MGIRPNKSTVVIIYGVMSCFVEYFHTIFMSVLRPRGTLKFCIGVRTGL